MTRHRRIATFATFLATIIAVVAPPGAADAKDIDTLAWGQCKRVAATASYAATIYVRADVTIPVMTLQVWGRPDGATSNKLVSTKATWTQLAANTSMRFFRVTWKDPMIGGKVYVTQKVAATSLIGASGLNEDDAEILNGYAWIFKAPKYNRRCTP